MALFNKKPKQPAGKLTGKQDRRTVELMRFIKSSIAKFFGSTAIGFVAGYFFAGGTMDIDYPWEMFQHFHDPGFDTSKMPTGLLLGLVVGLIWIAYGFMDYEKRKNSRTDEEYGSSKMMTARDMPRFNQMFFYDPKVCKQIDPKIKTEFNPTELKTVCTSVKHSKKETEACFLNSQILGQDVYISMNCKFINRNLNSLTLGGSGQGKSYSELFPNALNANANYIFTDPSGEIYMKIGKFLREQGYELRVFNVDEFDLSMKYNPIAYIKTEKDYNILVDALVDNINMGEKSGGDNAFFEKGAKSLECALIALLRELYPDNPEKQTFFNVMELLRMARQEADQQGNATSTLDELFAKLKVENPRSYAAKMWENFKVGGPKVCNEIIISSAADFGRYFDNPDIAWLTSKDELKLEEIASEKKVALFLIIPQATKSYNFLCSMVYSQLFDIVTKAGKAWRDDHGLDDPQLPRHLSFWLDEFANIGKIPHFLELLSVVRKYNISINIIIQGLTQLKAMYPKEEWETIMANLDSMIYLGGMEPSTVKWLSEKLGKETIKTHSYNLNNRSNGETYQNAGRNLLDPSEIEQMSRSHELIFISGCKPIQTKKYNLTEHPNYKFSGEADSKNNLRIAQELKDWDTEVDYDLLDESTITVAEIQGYDFSKLKVAHPVKNKPKPAENQNTAQAQTPNANNPVPQAGQPQSVKGVNVPGNLMNGINQKLMNDADRARREEELRNADSNLNQNASEAIKRHDVSTVTVYDGFTPAYEYTEDDFNIEEIQGLDIPDSLDDIPEVAESEAPDEVSVEIPDDIPIVDVDDADIPDTDTEDSKNDIKESENDQKMNKSDDEFLLITDERKEEESTDNQNETDDDGNSSDTQPVFSNSNLPF